MRGKLVGLLIASLVVLGAGCTAEGAAPEKPDSPQTAVAAPEKLHPETAVVAQERPNIVFILADDLSVEALNRNLSEYPNIRALAESGASFKNSFVTDPVCCPSRATSMTGMYPHNHGVEQKKLGGKEEAFQEIDDEALPVWLDGAGYRTGYFGKYLNGYEDDHTPPGWDVWRAAQIRRSEAGSFFPGFNHKGTNDEGQTHTQIFAEEVASFVKESGEPFFAYVAPYAPHIPAVHPERYDKLFTESQVPRTPSFNEQDVSDKPRWVADRDKLSTDQIEDADALYSDMLRSTKDVDEMVGRIVSALEESGELGNTYIVFTSDNGFHWGQHRLAPGKWTAYEEDIRVPLIVRGPDVPHGETRTGFALNNDLAPTFADWAGAEPSSAGVTVDGRSLAPLLSGGATPPTAWRDAFLVEAVRSNEPGLPRPAFKAIRTREHLYVEYASGERELYNLAQDPRQLQNLAGKRKEREAQLSGRLETLKACAGATCRKAEDSGSKNP